MIWTRTHIARRPRRCGSCGGRIRKGERYARHTAAPNHPDLGNTGWSSYTECAECAAICGRPVPMAGRAAADDQTTA